MWLQIFIDTVHISRYVNKLHAWKYYNYECKNFFKRIGLLLRPVIENDKTGINCF